MSITLDPNQVHHTHARTVGELKQLLEQLPDDAGFHFTSPDFAGSLAGTESLVSWRAVRRWDSELLVQFVTVR